MNKNLYLIAIYLFKKNYKLYVLLNSSKIIENFLLSLITNYLSHSMFIIKAFSFFLH